MTKYNIIEKKEKVTTLSYRRSVAPSFVEDVARKIIQKLMVEGNYRDPQYSAKRLADDIGINMRQASAVISCASSRTTRNWWATCECTKRSTCSKNASFAT